MSSGERNRKKGDLSRSYEFLFDRKTEKGKSPVEDFQDKIIQKEYLGLRGCPRENAWPTR